MVPRSPGHVTTKWERTEREILLRQTEDSIVPGRSADSRPANAKELAATAVIRLDLNEVSAKLRTGGPNDDAEDLALPHWRASSLTKGHGTPIPADDLAPGIELPDYLATL